MDRKFANGSLDRDHIVAFDESTSERMLQRISSHPIHTKRLV
jgi:hypothetical protein